MMIKVSMAASDGKSSFEFTSNCKELEQSISRVSRVISGGAANVQNLFIVSSAGKVGVLGFNTDTYVVIQLAEATSTKDGCFGFDFAHLQGLVKGRQAMTFTFDGAECSFKLLKGKYEGKFVTTPVTDDQAGLANSTLTREKGSDSVLVPSVMSAIRDGLGLTGIKDVYVDGGNPLSYLTLTDTELSVSCFDQHHFGLYTERVDHSGKPFKVALPASHFQIINQMLGAEEVKFSIRKESIRVEGKDFILILPASQAEDKNFNMVREYVEAIGDPDFSCKADMIRLSAITDNLFTIYSTNTAFELTCKAGQPYLNVTLSSNHGTAQDSMKVELNEGNLKVKVEPRILRDILGLVKKYKRIDLMAKKDKWLMLELETPSGALGSFVCSLTS